MFKKDHNLSALAMEPMARTYCTGN